MPAGADVSDIQRQENAVSEALVSQFLAADVVVGAPCTTSPCPASSRPGSTVLPNRAVPSSTPRRAPRAWPEGKTVIVVSTRGGMYSTSDMGRARSTRKATCKPCLASLGITDVRFVRAEGLGMGDAMKAQAMEQARAVGEREARQYGRRLPTPLP